MDGSLSLLEAAVAVLLFNFQALLMKVAGCLQFAHIGPNFWQL
jgi:hypothetical protein